MMSSLCLLLLSLGVTECNNDTEGAGDAMLLKVGSEMVELEEGTVKKKTQGSAWLSTVRGERGVGRGWMLTNH